MNDKTNEKLSVKYKTCSRYPYHIRNRQGGAILLGLIITMVIFGALSGAMVYVFSASALDSVFGNFAQRAYYASESGLRYAVATYRNALSDLDGKTKLASFSTPRTIALPNGGSFTLTVTLPSIAATTTAAGSQEVNVGENLSLSSGTTGFPAKNGTFTIGGNTYRYKTLKTLNGNSLELISGPASSFPIVINTPKTITSPANQVSITSKGYFPSILGIGLSRTVEYGWILSGLGGGPIPPQVISLAELVANNPFGNDPSLGKWMTEQVGGNVALTVDQSTKGVRVEAVIGYSGTWNPFQAAWESAGHFLSYDAQVKIATGTPSGSPFIAKPSNYVGGLTFSSRGTNPGEWRSYGLSFMKYGGSGIPPSMNPRIYPDWSNTKSPVYAWGDGVTIIDQGQGNFKNYKCNADKCPPTAKGNFNVAIWVEYNPPMIMLWTRGGRGVDGDYWLAYKLLDTEQTNGVVDTNGYLKDWSTILLRVVEAASLEFNSTTDFIVGDTVQSGAIYGIVIKKIMSGSKEYLLLNNVSGTFVNGDTITATGRTETTTTGFRARDNYIWAMFGDTHSHPTADTTAINETRLANQRLTGAESADPTKIHWPENNIADWGKDIDPPNDVKNDYFKLVDWASMLNTTIDSTLRIMGTDKEAGAILRTNLWLTDAYTVSAFPHEFGVHAIGDQAVNTYFDDLAISFQERSSSGSPYVPPIQQ